MRNYILLIMGNAIWWQNKVNIGSGNGLLLDGNKSLPESVLTYHKGGPVAFT